MKSFIFGCVLVPLSLQPALRSPKASFLLFPLMVTVSSPSPQNCCLPTHVASPPTSPPGCRVPPLLRTHGRRWETQNQTFCKTGCVWLDPARDLCPCVLARPVFLPLCGVNSCGPFLSSPATPEHQLRELSLARCLGVFMQSFGWAS